MVSRSTRQIQALLLRTWHIQRKRHCLNFCIIICPSIALVALALLARLIKSRSITSFPFERDPRGAFVARPFTPLECLRGSVPSSQINGDTNNIENSPLFANCEADPFVPKWTVPVARSPQYAEPVGKRNATSSDQQDNSGILGSLSLYPYVYPPALPRGEGDFHETQTPYDGVFLNTFFQGNKSSRLYQATALVASDESRLNELYEVSTTLLPSRAALLDLLFQDWFRGGTLGKHYGAFYFDRAELSENSVEINATLFFNSSLQSNCTRACQLTSNLIRLESAIFESANPQNSANVYLRRMPVIDVERDLGFVRLIISILIGSVFHFLLPVSLGLLVLEREERLRDLMSMMGLNARRYWFGTYLGLFLQYVIVSVLFIIVGFAASISFFTANTPLSYIVLFFIW